MNVVTVGGNAVSAFLSWRLQATNACDVTLVWKSGFDHVAQYGISFKSVYYSLVESSRARCAMRPETTDFLPLLLCFMYSPLTCAISHRSSVFGNERFKPRHGMSLLLWIALP